MLEAGDVMGSVAVGIFDATLKEYKAYKQVVVWPGKTMEVPADYFSGEPWCMDCDRPFLSAPALTMHALVFALSAPVFAIVPVGCDWTIVRCFALMALR